jgi:alcohol dehydrogenase, propanol-preferring
MMLLQEHLLRVGTTCRSSECSPCVLAAQAGSLPGPGQLLMRVRACGVCRTDLHVVDGELPTPKPYVVLGHEVVGTVELLGEGVDRFSIGQRVGVPWLGWTCGTCRYCRSGRENLCDNAKFTGYTLDGGYAEFVVANQQYCFAIPDGTGQSSSFGHHPRRH